MPKSVDHLFDPEITPKNVAGRTKKLDTKARNHVIKTYERYDSMRNITQGGLNYNVTARWDELYRLYMAIRNDDDHDYQGSARVFMPVIRRAINVLDAESSNALFSKDAYFSSVPIGDDPENRDMARRCYAILKYYSDKEGYVEEYELAKKQCFIYGCTAGEVTYWRESYSNLTRKKETVDVIDDRTGDTLYNNKGEAETRDEYNIFKVDTTVHHPQILVRDIYRLYIDINSHDPEKKDLLYRDAMSAQKLLEMVEDGVYNRTAVTELLKMMPTGSASESESTNNSGQGKTVVSDNRGAADAELYDVFRFQGLFTEKDETGKVVKREQYWIDVGERKQVLRIQKNPLLSKEKTFVLTNYDSMISEFYTDGVANPIKSLQYEINDKECQSLDGVGYDLNAPFEVLKSSGLDDVDIEAIYEEPHKALFVREKNSIRKVVAQFNVSHLNMELTRLNQFVDNVTGSVSALAGTPTGTQADRSGKAISLLQNQTKSQFSRFIRKFERNFLQRSLQKLWGLMVQFSDDEVEIELFDDKGVAKSPYNQKVNEIIGQFNIRVTGGSQYIKERDYRDAMLEFVSVISLNDMFMQMLDPAPLLQEIAKSSPYDLSRFVNPDNLYQKQKQQIDELTQLMNQANDQLKMYGGEIKRLSGELSQTSRSNMISPPISKGAAGGK